MLFGAGVASYQDRKALFSTMMTGDIVCLITMLGMTAQLIWISIEVDR
jgi:hypothetical protein